MKETITLWLSAAGLLTFAGLASAVPPFPYVNRQSGNWLSAESFEEDGSGGSVYRVFSASELYDNKGNYRFSSFWISEHGYSSTLMGYFSRYASCPMDLGAIAISKTTTTATYSANIADLTDCWTSYSNAEPFTELDISASFSAPGGTTKENHSGSTSAGGSTYKYTCRQTESANYFNVALVVNGETWMRTGGEEYLDTFASSRVCNVNDR